MIPVTKDAYKLLHEGALAFADIERNGIRVDVKKLEHNIDKVTARIKKLRGLLREDEVYRVWKRHFGAKANMDSAPQLGTILFDVMGIKGGSRTEKSGQWKTTEEALEKLKHPYVQRYFKIKKLAKLRSTYLIGLRNQIEGDRTHSFFNLHNVITYRSSSSEVNLQNQPIRNKKIAPLIRECYIPSSVDHELIEVDLKANEVRIACVYTDDQKLIHDTLEGDMHRDMAMEIFKLRKAQVSKETRNTAKNGFVFAQFYGDYYAACARYMWDQVEKYSLSVVDGPGLYEHLAANGIRGRGKCEGKPTPGTFEAHVKEVEHKFWKKRYKTYDRWRLDWWEDYLERGWFQMLTGFVGQGVYDRNQVINSPIQGTAFHCLLWALIKLSKWLRKNKMRSKIVAQVHDSILGDVYKPERAAYLAKLKSLLIDEIRKHWEWLTLPLAVEAEASDKNWFAKEEIAI